MKEDEMGNWSRALQAYAFEIVSIYARAIKREIDGNEAKQQLAEIFEKRKVLYFTLLKAENND